MKKYRIAFILGLFSFMFACSSGELNKSGLIGKWDCVKLNDHPIKEHGFNSIQMEILSNDSVVIITEMNSFGETTTKSKGTWSIKNGKIKAKIGDTYQESIVKFSDGSLTFIPDLLFNSETVKKSEYKKIQ